MLSLVIVLLAGVIIGAFPRLPDFVYNFSDRMLHAGLFGLLFFMGVKLGISPDIVGQIKTIGVRAFLFAVCTLIGSVLVVWGMERFLAKNAKDLK